MPIASPRARWALMRTGGLTLGGLAAATAAVYGRRPAHLLAAPSPHPWLPPGEVSHEQVALFVGRAAAVLAHDLGVRPGDRVVVAPDNRIDALWWILAACAAGATAVPVNAASGPDDLAWACENSGAACVITDKALFRARIRRKAALPGVRTFALADAPAPRPGFASLPALVAARRIPLPPLAVDPAVILYTSGTTGRAKGVVLTHAALLSGLGWTAAVPTWPRQLVVDALPVAHIMGLSVGLTALVAGVPLLHLPRFRPGEVLDALEYRGATCYVGVPTTYRRLEEAGAAHRDLSGVRLWISAADVMPPDLSHRFQSYGRARRPLPLPAFFVEGYGMVESGGAAMLRVAWPGRGRAGPGFVGAPLPGWQARIVDDAGRPVARRTTGELELRGPGVLSGYVGDPCATLGAVRDGWLRTGDLAFRDRLGLVHFAGRSKEVIKSGGYSVFPAEVETALREHPEVADAVVFGLPDRDKGEVPAAAIVPAAGARPDADAIAAWAKERLARYKAPRRVFVVPRADLPEGPTRKVLRSELALRFGG